jgi:hypothetical protein
MAVTWFTVAMMDVAYLVAMMDVEFYRAEAERCHQLAEGSKDPEAAARWRAMSRDYHALADELEAAEPPTVHRSGSAAALGR